MTKIKEALDFAQRSLGDIAQREISESYRRILCVLDEISVKAGGYEGRRVLDVGCSIGLHAVAAARLGATVYGLDKFTFPEIANPSPFQLTQNEFQSVQKVWNGNGVRVFMHDLEERFPFDDGFFDIVVSNAVIEHLHGTHQHYLKECFRVLKPNGYLLVSTPNLTSILKRIRFLIGRSPNWDLKDFYSSQKSFTGHTREFTVQELVCMAKMSGFNVVCAEAKPTYFRWRWFKKPSKYVGILVFCLGFLSRRFGDHNFVLVQKPSASVPV